jgi:hypothetical protein
MGIKYNNITDGKFFKCYLIPEICNVLVIFKLYDTVVSIDIANIM